MVSKEKIKLMTEIAIYEKKYKDRDKKIDSFYRYDYIYKKNAANRFGIFIGLCFAFLLIALDIIYIKHADILALDYKALGTKVFFILLSIFAVYTSIGIFRYGKEYDLSQKRYKKYFFMLEILNNNKYELKSTNKRKLKLRKTLKNTFGGSHERDISD